MTQRHADGEPFNGELIAVLDETSPAMGSGVYYVVSCAVILNDMGIGIGLKGLFADTPNRKQPFHWHKEGPVARGKMIELITGHSVVAISRYQSVGRKGQARARQLLLPAIAEDLERERIDHLVIESGDAATDARDRTALLDHYRDRGGVPFTYDWRTKNEPIVWIADAINGMVHDYFTKNTSHLDRLISAGVMTEPQYLA